MTTPTTTNLRNRNPTIEEQALARIHRIGQTREVTTVRFYIRDSFEERVMEVQESKKNLAGVLLSGHDGGQADDSLGALQVCRFFLIHHCMVILTPSQRLRSLL